VADRTSTPNRSPESREQRRAYGRAYIARPEVKEIRRARNRTEDSRAAGRERRHQARLSNPEAERDAKLRHRYGITLEAYEQMLEAQGGVCAVCEQLPEQGRRLSVDHDHSSGAIRGLLCHLCNSGLGHLKDDLATVERLVLYLKSAHGG